MRDHADPLLVYVREARNQLAHRESVLWVSDEESQKPEGLGAIVTLEDSYYIANKKRYSCTVLPSLVLNFVGSEVAAKPLFSKNGDLIAVPVSHMDRPIDNSSFKIMECSYEFYGQSFIALFQQCRKQ